MIHAIPLYFGPSQQLFGWYHAALGPVFRACSIVLCPPLGHEYVCSYRAYRLLADKLASNGFSVLRFDYLGTGNSASGAGESHLLRRWMDSIYAATAELRARIPDSPIALVGLRLGATLAAMSAIEHENVETLVLWEPCVSGKAYVRQVKILGMTSTEHPDQLAANLGIEAAGFMFSSATVDELSELRLTHTFGTVNARALVLSRDDLPTDPSLAGHLRTLGATVDEQSFSGYSSFMMAPVDSELPTQTLDTITEWFVNAYPSTTPNTAVISARARPSESTNTRTEHRDQHDPQHLTYEVQETAVRFGDRLFGIFVTPTERDPTKPAVVLLNTGGDHHIGPHRMYVPLARDWAARGFGVLRFDLSGLGDSPARPGATENSAYSVNALDDIRAAVEYLREQKYQRIIMVGVCSGAYYAIYAAQQGVPVIGTIAVNPPFYSGEGGSLSLDPYWNEVEIARIRRAMFAPEKWARFFTGKIDYKYTLSLILGRAHVLGTRALSLVRRLASGHLHATADLGVMAFFPPHIHTHLIFSRDDPGFTYVARSAGEQLETLNDRPNFSIEIVDDADHTFMPVKLQDRLAQLLTQALVSHFRDPVISAHAYQVGGVYSKS